MPSSSDSSSSSAPSSPSPKKDDPSQVRDEIDYNDVRTIEPIIRRYIMGPKPSDIDISRARRLNAIQDIITKLGEGSLTGLENDLRQDEQIQKAMVSLKRATEKLLVSRVTVGIPLDREREVKRKRRTDENDSGRCEVERWEIKVDNIRRKQEADCAKRAAWPDHPEYIRSEVYVTQDDLDKEKRRISELAILEFEYAMKDPRWRKSKTFGMCDAEWLRMLTVYVSKILTDDGIKCVRNTLSDLRRLFIPERVPVALRTLLRNHQCKGRERSSFQDKDFWYLYSASDLCRQMHRIKCLLREKDENIMDFMKFDPDVVQIVHAVGTKQSAQTIMDAWVAMQVYPELRSKDVDLKKELQVCLCDLDHRLAFGEHMLAFEEKFSKAIFLLFPPQWSQLFTSPPDPPSAFFTRKLLDDLCEHFPQLPGIIRQLLPIADVMDPNIPFSEKPPPHYNFENGSFDGSAESLEVLFDHEPISPKSSDSSDDEVSVNQENGEENKSALHVKPKDAKSVRATLHTQEILKAKTGAEHAKDSIKTRNHKAAIHSMARIFRAIGVKFVQEHQRAAARPLTRMQEAAVGPCAEMGNGPENLDGIDEAEPTNKSRSCTADAHAGRGIIKSVQAESNFNALVQQEKNKAKEGGAWDKTKTESPGVRLGLPNWSETTGEEPEKLSKMMIGLNEIKVPGIHSNKYDDKNVKPSGDGIESFGGVIAANRTPGPREPDANVPNAPAGNGRGHGSVQNDSFRAAGADHAGVTDDVGDTDGDAHAKDAEDSHMDVDDDDADEEDNVS